MERSIEAIQKSWSQPGAPAQPNAPGWNAFFDALRDELRRYSTAQGENDRLVSLNRIYQFSVALGGTAWRPGQELREELRTWLRPRVRLAWAERRLVESVRGLAPPATGAARSNRERWISFVGNDLGSALRQYDAATTVLQRQEALKRVYAALNALQAKNGAAAWVPSVQLEAALNDLYNLPNLDISADVTSLAPALSADVVQTGPIEHKGYISMVTAGPKTGFGLLPSDDGIAFYNKQMSASVTPIWDFQNQMQRDRRGRQATKLYQFAATSNDTSEVTAVAVLRPSGLSVLPLQSHNTDAIITSFKQPGKGFARFVASAVGFNQPKVTQKVYEGAIGQVRQNVVTEGAEVAQEKSAQQVAAKNAQLARFLIGGNALAFRNLLITGLTLRSLPTNALIGGKLQWRGAQEQVGADAPQPAKLAIPDPGVSADLHLSSILTSLTRGYLQSDAVRGLENLMIVTKKIPPGAPPREGIEVARNADFGAFLKAVDAAQAANDPKVLAVRIKRPGRSPEFAADANGFLVALVHDFLIEIPVPPSARAGSFAAPPARVYRITAPDAEFSISFKVTPQTQTSPVRLAGRIEGFDPGPGATVYAINEDEGRAQPLTAFTSTFVLGIFRAKIQGQPIDVPLSNLRMQGFAIKSVTALEPSGWIRVDLVRTSFAPSAGIQ
ncbi:MAG TPA: hypothetical protein VKP69_06220 [Isosphaeraceae bacterium]|nr:hypothetical protein [Isosphaeraceae bacterium]